MLSSAPSRLHQILISDSSIDQDHLPKNLTENIASLKSCYPDTPYTLWTLPKIKEFLVKNFDPAILECFNLLKPFAYKADLARLCIIYHYGGLYADIGLRFLNPITPPKGFGIAAFQDTPNGTPFWCAVSNAIIWCNPKRLDIKIAIDLIVANCKEKYYGENSLYPTGPVVFGAAISKGMSKCKYTNLKAEEYYIGNIYSFFPFTSKWSIIFIDPHQNIIAIRQKSISSLTEKTLKTNHYGKLWASKEIYSETISLWYCTDSAIQVGDYGLRTRKGIKSKREQTGGLLTFGPYIDISAGNYTLTIDLKNYRLSSSINVSISYDYGTKIIVSKNYPIIADPYDPLDFTIPFKITMPIRSVEFLITSDNRLNSEIICFTLQKTS